MLVHIFLKPERLAMGLICRSEGSGHCRNTSSEHLPLCSQYAFAFYFGLQEGLCFAHLLKLFIASLCHFSSRATADTCSCNGAAEPQSGRGHLAERFPGTSTGVGEYSRVIPLCFRNFANGSSPSVGSTGLQGRPWEWLSACGPALPYPALGLRGLQATSPQPDVRSTPLHRRTHTTGGTGLPCGI
ncbi:hypothetical protein AAY473_031481 [Plecturocebus cupreus]